MVGIMATNFYLSLVKKKTLEQMHIIDFKQRVWMISMSRVANKLYNHAILPLSREFNKNYENLGRNEHEKT